MAPRLKQLIQTFPFSEDQRSNVTLGPDVRLNPDMHWLQLEEQADDTYKTDSGLFAKTRVTTLRQLKKWLGFEAVAIHPRDDLGADLTSLGFRLSDSTDEFWWNGSVWVANTTNWNTEAEVAAKIDQFSVDSQSLQIVINLVTTDKTVTPVLKAIKLMFESELEHQEDYVWRSLIPDLRNKVRPITDHPFVVPTTRNTLDLKVDFKIETPYNVVGIDSVYDHTNDPKHLNDLFSSFDPNTLVVTLSASIVGGDVAWVRFIYEPEVAVTTGQEYSEIAKVPALILSEIELVDSKEAGQEQSVSNKTAGSVKVLPGPLIADIQFTVRLLTNKAKDQVRLADEMKRYFIENPLLRSKGLDRDFRLWLIEEYRQTTEPTQKEIHSGRLRFRIVEALFFEKRAVDKFVVERFNLSGDMNVVIN